MFSFSLRNLANLKDAKISKNIDRVDIQASEKHNICLFKFFFYFILQHF